METASAYWSHSPSRRSVTLQMTDHLVCVECGAVAPEGAVDWKAEIGDDLRDDDPPDVEILCPTCWRREFGS